VKLDEALAVFIFHEIKPLDANAQEIQDCEYQILEACMRYLEKKENKSIEFVYAVISFDTKGRT
jgi:hypothetical protein